MVLILFSSFFFKGYLKISIQVIGPGDEPKTPPAEVSKESVDIEALVDRLSTNSIYLVHVLKL